ncbi:MAG: endonuclease III [Spirochaetales bacterium]|nr:endonuclease III [Spirochaetales bacterium]
MSIDVKKTIRILKKHLAKTQLPSVSQVAEETADPFRILVSTIISLRTKDQVTMEASGRLFDVIKTPADLARLTHKRIERLIYPAGFYKTKAKTLKKIAGILIDKYDSAVPDTEEQLLSLPGVGRKTANLVLNLGFGIQAVCVDTHVHRVSNRLGWVKSKKPEETERQLMEILPGKEWIAINELLVQFGQTVCRPVGPKCDACPVFLYCKRVGVEKK